MVYRGNIVEVCSDSIVVITEECTFKRIKKSVGLEEGMEVYFEERDIIRKSNTSIKSIKSIKSISKIAAIILLVITSIYGIQVWDINYRAVAIVSIDINPSVEIKVNKNHRVINATALNEDALNLPLKKLKGQVLANALDELVQTAKTEGYIKENEENYILLGVVGLSNNEKDTEALEHLLVEGKEKIENVSSEDVQYIEVVTVESNKETLKKARKEHISVGRMEVYENNKDNNKDGQSSKEEIKELKEEKVKELIEKIGKEHPVFEEHPGNNNNSDKDKKKVKDEKIKEEKVEKEEKEEKEEGIGQNKDKDNNGKKDNNNNKDKNKDKDINNEKDKDKDKDSKDDKDNKDSKDKDKDSKNNKDEIKNKKSHPVFEEHPGNSKSNNPSKQYKEKIKDKKDD
ncbi:anti-sigma factor domain-containing protein [Tissierella sp.]|uniref:anti-sigma factor domain-containing protein n=1 Tax=Tissierella sp. TaxID=41274 RepID=UPI002860A98D|nr:anti-sigma factor domain-containing protein [Tissierella sp.]MDR7857340.1 anti-sigma factor domain-containing protein [Tissierella sp.]